MFFSRRLRGSTIGVRLSAVKWGLKRYLESKGRRPRDSFPFDDFPSVFQVVKLCIAERCPETSDDETYIPDAEVDQLLGHVRPL